MCPPGVDQTTRSPQQWHILAPRIRKIHPLSTEAWDCESTPRAILFKDRRPWDAWSKLARPARPTRKQSTRSVVPGRRANALSKIELLPTELITSILENPSLERSDVIAVGLTCETLWSHVLQHVEKDCWLTAAPLADVEIACTGTWLTDLPESFAKDDLARSSVQISLGGYMCEARKINWAAICHYDAVQDSEEMWRAALKAPDTLAAGIPTTLAKEMAVQLLSRCSTLRGSSPDAPWVLRNLTTKEYVRCRPGRVPKERHGYVDHPGVVKLRVDDVLLLRICWTVPFEWRESLGINRGPWAGHCFDIVPSKQGSVSAVGSEWKDVTNEIVEQAMTVAEKILPRGASGLTRSSRKRKADIERTEGSKPAQNGARVGWHMYVRERILSFINQESR